MASLLDQAAASRFGPTAASARIVSRTPIDYDPFLPGRSLDRVQAIATAGDGGPVPFTAIVKCTDGPGLRSARRELAVYRDLTTTVVGAECLGAPALLAWDDSAEHVEIWLEELRDEHGGVWPVSRFGLAARHIARWDMAAGRLGPIPGFDSEDAWAERHGQPERLGDAAERLDRLRHAPDSDQAMAVLEDEGFRRTQAMIESVPARIARLAALPQTLLHHDLVRSNLFAVAGGVTVAIDWENVGRGPLGVDLAPLVSGSVRRGEASADDLAELEAVVLGEYRAALVEFDVDPSTVESAYRDALALRWHVVLGALESAISTGSGDAGAPSQAGRGSRPDEPVDESLRHLMALARHLLDAAEENSG